MKQCVVCHSPASSLQPLWRGLVRCQNCGHRMADLDLDAFDARSLYQISYFIGGEYADYPQDRRVYEQHFRQRLRMVQKFCPSGTLIEIGCGYGFFLALAQRFYQVRGFDIASEAIAHARDRLGVDARQEEFLDVEIPEESVDVVAMWDTIEHLPRPDLVVKKIARILRPGGVVALTTGDIDSKMARWRGQNWRLIHPPTHLHYFSRQTIDRLLASEGLHPLARKYVAMSRSLRQVVFSLAVQKRDKEPWFYRWLKNSRLGSLSFSLNMYDIIFIVARKERL
ncbi:MAG: class I SAM-dependent methyltransferase [Candidatus Aminicenantes bacterium]|nr:class I SAM-dependent methyltransferase [Candidatus Aminicenantes bacterium]